MGHALSDLFDWEIELAKVTGNEDLVDWTFAESGVSGGGGGGGGTPPLPNTVLWYDASRLTGADGSALASWPVVGAAPYNLLQATGAHQPTLYTTTPAKLVNGLPAVWFSGNQWMVPAPTPASFSTPLSVYVIANMTNAPALGVFYDGFVAEDLLLYCDNTNWNGKCGGTFYGGFAAATAGAHLFVSVLPGSGASTVYLDGTAHNLGALGSATPTPFTFGASQSLTDPLTGCICEVGLYTSALVASDAATIHAYAQSKWGTP